MERLDNKVNTQIDKLNENKVRYNKWYIKKVEFSNFLSFGDNNVIDFTNLDGITVIESNPKNFGGKSTSSVDLLMFLFFNTTTKTKTNGEIFNRFTDKNEVSVRGEITIDGEDYVIERKTFRKMSKSGEYTIKNELEFFKKSEDGSIINLSGDQRTFTWGSNGRKLMNVPFDENPYSAFAAFLKTDEGVEIYKSIDKKL